MSAPDLSARPEPTPVDDLAAALRRVTDLVVGRVVPDHELRAAARRVSALADHLAAVAEPGKAPRAAPDRSRPPQEYFSTSPVVGFANPLSPPVQVWAVPGDNGVPEMRGRVVFGYAYEGPPTCVHGGVIAELLDELLGVTNILTGHAGMTGTLAIRYRRPTPLLTPLDLEARLDKVHGRKTFMRGAILHNGTVTAEAQGLFVEAGARKMLEAVKANVAGAEGEVLDEGMAAAIQMARSRPSQ